MNEEKKEELEQPPAIPESPEDKLQRMNLLLDTAGKLAAEIGSPLIVIRLDQTERPLLSASGAPRALLCEMSEFAVEQFQPLYRKIKS